MVKKKSKYDTNPLDPDFVRRTEEVHGETGEQTRQMSGGDGVDMEAPTRYYPQQQPSASAYDSQPYNPQARYREAEPTSYPSVFIPPPYQPPPAPQGTVPHAQVFQQPPPFQQQSRKPTARTVPGLGLPENVLMILPYLPLPLVGIVPGLVELLMNPRKEWRVRFHAAQGLALHLAVLAISTLFSTAEGIAHSIMPRPFSLLLGAASTLFTLAATVFFIISMIRVWKGEPHEVALLRQATRWLNEKLDPRK